MTWPHHRSFRGRSLIFWGLLLAALLRARSVPGVSARVVALGALVAAVVCGVIYAYTAALGRQDARFRHIHPRKFRIVDVGGFYLFAGLACGLLVGAPWLAKHDQRGTPAGLMAYYLVVPCLLSAAAGVYRVLDRYRAMNSIGARVTARSSGGQ